MKYKGPPKRFTMEESDELRTKAHAYSTDLQTGEVIIEELPGYESAGKKDIILNDKKVAEITKPKPEIDINKEVDRLYKKEFPIPPNTIKTEESERDKQLERDALQWKKYFKDNQGKIPNRIPKTIFDRKKDSNDNKNE